MLEDKDPDDRDSGFGVSGDQGPKTSEVYEFVGSITTVVATGLPILIFKKLSLLLGLPGNACAQASPVSGYRADSFSGVGISSRTLVALFGNCLLSKQYGHLASKMGSEYLAKLLSKHLEQFIKARIPSITSPINKSIDELESELDHLGRPIAVDAGAQLYTILELCRTFDKIFKEHLDGGRPGGDRIYGVFDNQLPAALRKLPLDRYLSVQNVRKVVSEADGYQPHLIAPEQGYRRLIEGALNYFRGPAEASVDAVHFVLKELVRKSIGECQELKRFPSLQSTIAAASNEALEKFRDEGRKTVVRLVDMESSYLTVDFFRKLPQEMETPKGGKPEASAAVDRYGEAHFRRIDEDPALMERRMQCAKRFELYKKARDEIDSVAWVR
ncbi:hypothetical protein KY285_001984 [Solanum tuberosum]|nr:hypothetical protein KY285_001984 [Solanum tuberosum]